jgi:hypothetical protein
MLVSSYLLVWMCEEAPGGRLPNHRRTRRWRRNLARLVTTGIRGESASTLEFMLDDQFRAELNA